MYVCACYSSIISRVHLACAGRGRVTKVGKYGFAWAAPHGTVANFGRSQGVITFVKIGILQHRWHETSTQYIQAYNPSSGPSSSSYTVAFTACLHFSSHTT